MIFHDITGFQKRGFLKIILIYHQFDNKKQDLFEWRDDSKNPIWIDALKCRILRLSNFCINYSKKTDMRNDE